MVIVQNMMNFKSKGEKKVKYIAKLGICVCLLFSINVQAGPGHGHSHAESSKSITAIRAKMVANSVVKQKIKDGKLGEEWLKIAPNKPVQKTFKGKKEWVITFDNPKATDETKKRLYVFVSQSGRPTGINFTGN